MSDQGSEDVVSKMAGVVAARLRVEFSYYKMTEYLWVAYFGTFLAISHW